MKCNLALGLKALFLVLFFQGASALVDLPAAPTATNHPGSKIYPYSYLQKNLVCSGRTVINFVPVSNNPNETFPVLIFAQDHHLSLSHYRASLEHAAKKGVIVVFANYDEGYFDSDWQRMGRDLIGLADCAIRSLAPRPDRQAVVYAGHAKGAYVASIAAGIAAREFYPVRAKSILLFDPKGFDFNSWPYIDADVPTNIVMSDRSSSKSVKIARTLYNYSRSERKQLVTLKSYLNTTQKLKATNNWLLTKSEYLGLHSENALHYYGFWKWIVSVSRDLKSGPEDLKASAYIYGAGAIDKGIPGFYDQIQKNF